MKARRGMVWVCAILGLALVAAEGVELREHSSGYRGTENLIFDGRGGLYVTDTNHLWRVEDGGAPAAIYERDPSEDSVSLGGVSIGPDGRVYFSVGNRIKTYDPFSGAVEVFAEGFDFANGNCFDDFGNLYIADANAKRIYIVRAGSGEVEILKDRAGWVNGLVWSRRDNALYFTISSPGRVGMLRLGAGPIIVEELTLVRFPWYGLDDLTIDDDGVIYVCAWLNGKVVKVTPGGNKQIIVNKLDGPSALSFGQGPDRGKLYITIKGVTTKFLGDRILELDLAAPGYAEPFTMPETD